MAEVTGLTADRMLEIEAASVVSGTVDVNGHLILTTEGGDTIDAGLVKSSVAGPTGPSGAVTGEIKMYTGVSLPSGGYLSCNGQAVSRTTYSALFAIVGTVYGTGDGSTTFNLPNLTSKFPRGNTPGPGAGADTHTHTAAAHTHPLSSNGQALVSGSGTVVGLGPLISTASWTEQFRINGASAGTPGTRTAAVSLAGATDSTTPGNTGSSSNVPAYAGVWFIIKT